MIAKIIAPYGPDHVLAHATAGCEQIAANVFMIGGEDSQFWHAVTSGGTDRISFGFRPL
jgi:hypothetical protein